jgi:type VI secretion system protein ImpA
MNVVAFPHKTDLDAFLEPIPGMNPAGESLRYQGTYDRISEARREDDPTLSQGIYKSSLKRADWANAANICIEALTARTKDLQIAGWLLEAWLNLEGFAGAAKGLRVMAGLCEQFWDDVYPRVELGDLEGRLAPFEWIEQKLALKLKQVPLTAPGEMTESYSYVDWERACHFENLAMKDPRALQEALAKIDPTMTVFRAAMMETDRAYILNIICDLDDAIDACVTVEQVLQEKCGKDAPGLGQFREALNAIQQLLAQDVRPLDEDVAPGTELIGDEPRAAEVELWTSGPIRSRADAYRRLSEAADYLLHTEPHSPTPYLVKRAVEWGQMSLPELLQQIVRNESELNEIDRLLRLTGDRWSP